jgi:protein-S-isoprenylcysteine O-methyltransferase Ste14
MDGNLEFRVLLYYLAALYFFPFIYWRKARRSPAVVGAYGERQRRGRLVATGFFVIPLVNYLIDGPWPWYPTLGLPAFLRWSAAIPATLAILLFVWACRQTQGGRGLGEEQFEKWFVNDGPYASLRHPQLLASSLLFLSLALLANNGVVLISAIVGVFVLRLVVAPAVDADLKQEFGERYEEYRQRTGSFFLGLRRIPQAQYAVPRRFGLSSVLALTTIFAIIFGSLNYMGASPVAYLFVSTEISAICLAQIIFGSAARSASAVIGAMLLPFWMAISFAAERNRLDPIELIIVGIILMVPGAILGYFIGTLAAGFFLAMDLLEPYLPGYKSDSLNSLTAKPDHEAN